MEQELAEIVANEALRFGFTVEQVRSRRVTTPYVKARRRIARVAAYEGFSEQEIGQAIGRHRTTVISLLHGRRP